MTPRELSYEQAAARKHDERDQERDLFVAWQTAAFVGQAFVGQLQPWESIQARVQLSGQSPDEMTTQLEFLSRVTGFPLIRH